MKRHELTEAFPESQEYFLECFRVACEELTFRVKHRDNWLKIQLLTQVTLLALAFGVELGGVKSSTGIPVVLMLAIPASTLLAALYVVEDRLVTLTARYIANINRNSADTRSEIILPQNLEASEEMQEFGESALPVRLLAQLVAFGVMPASLAYYRFFHHGLSPELAPEFFMSGLLWVIGLFLVVNSYVKRKNMYKIA